MVREANGVHTLMLCWLAVAGIACGGRGGGPAGEDLGTRDASGADPGTADIVSVADRAEVADASADRPRFPPETQEPVFEKGFILPPDSLPCVPRSTGVPQTRCNHHASAVAWLPDGAMAAVWYHGEFEKSLDSRLVWSRKPAGAREWTWPEVLYDDPDHSDGNPTLWVREDGTLFVFVAVIVGNGWDDAEVRMLTSEDGGATWSAPVTLRSAWCWNVRHRPARLANGDLLLPLYNECLALPVFLRTRDDFATWEEQFDPPDPQYLLDHLGQIQPALVVTGDGGLAAITRDGTAKNRIHRMESHDHGLTWTPSEPLDLPNSGTSVDQARLADGHVVVVFNNDPDRRFPLSAAWSLDEGRTFIAIRDLAADCPEGGCSFAYPSVAQDLGDGTIWVTYTHDRRTIGWVRFNEAWLAQGTQPARVHCLWPQVCRDGACFPPCGGAAECPAGACREGACGTPCSDASDCAAGTCGPSGLCLPPPPTDRVRVVCS